MKVWHKAHALTLQVYNINNDFPRKELYGLTSQMRRAAVPVGANIAEGCCRKGDIEFSRFLQIAMGSASELEYELLVARDLKLVKASDFQLLEDEVTNVKRMLSALIFKLRANN